MTQIPLLYMRTQPVNLLCTSSLLVRLRCAGQSRGNLHKRRALALQDGFCKQPIKGPAFLAFHGKDLRAAQRTSLCRAEAPVKAEGPSVVSLTHCCS